MDCGVERYEVDGGHSQSLQQHLWEAFISSNINAKAVGSTTGTCQTQIHHWCLSECLHTRSEGPREQSVLPSWCRADTRTGGTRGGLCWETTCLADARPAAPEVTCGRRAPA